MRIDLGVPFKKRGPGFTCATSTLPLPIEDALLEIATSLGGSIPARASMAAFDDAARTHDRHVSFSTARLTPNEKVNSVSETSHGISDLLKQMLGNIKSVDKEKALNEPYSYILMNQL